MSTDVATVEEQLETLVGLGVQLRDGLTVDAVLARRERSVLEAEPYGLLLAVLGDVNHGLSDSVTTFDIATTDVEIYEDLVRRFARMADVAMEEDAVRLIPGHGLELELAYPHADGTRRWHVAVSNDRLDVQVLYFVVKDFEPKDGSRIFAGWQDDTRVVMVCVAPAALEKLSALPGPHSFRAWV